MFASRHNLYLLFLTIPNFSKLISDIVKVDLSHTGETFSVRGFHHINQMLGFDHCRFKDCSNFSVSNY